jgi:hypothetical protein
LVTRLQAHTPVVPSATRSAEARQSSTTKILTSSPL